ncbi:7TM diverse intracellular signaling domain-containing protein [Shivajiella indica]|uniref:histidine kinase n=1 Tax=Shivajiella indica TaxID=872115 RepID=A0ABW5B8H7_9BACT
MIKHTQGNFVREYFHSINLSLGLIFFLFFSCDLPKRETLTYFTEKALGQSVAEAWTTTDSIYVSNGKFNAGITPYAWWIRTSISNPNPFPKQYVLLLNNPHINQLEIFFNGEDKARYITGDYFPFEQRPFLDRGLVVPLDLKPKSTIELLLLADKRGETFLIEPQLVDINSFYEIRTGENLIIGITSGWMLMILIFTCFFAWELKDSTAIFYALYIVSLLFWLISHWGLGFQYLWPQSTVWASNSRPFFNLMTNVLFLVVVLKFFPPIGKSKYLGYAVWAIIILQIMLLINFMMSEPSSITTQDKMIFLYLTIIISIVVTFLILYYLFLQWKAEVPFVGLYLAGIMVLLFFNVVIQLNQSGISLGLPQFLFNFGSAFGLMGETAFITLAFARRAGTYKREKEKLAIEILQKEKNIADQIIRVQEEERNRLGRDLHDSIGGMLASIHIQADKIAGEHPNAQSVGKLKEMVANSIQEARSLSHNLTPPHLDDLGLEKVLQNHVNMISENHHLAVNYYYDIPIDLPKALQLMVYRICSELLHNVIKHAQASEVMVQLILQESNLEIIVEDNGKGMSGTRKINGIGLKNLQDRVSYLKGEMHIDSNAGGTTVIITIPVKKD